MLTKTYNGRNLKKKEATKIFKFCIGKKAHQTESNTKENC